MHGQAVACLERGDGTGALAPPDAGEVCAADSLAVASDYELAIRAPAPHPERRVPMKVGVCAETETTPARGATGKQPEGQRARQRHPDAGRHRVRCVDGHPLLPNGQRAPSLTGRYRRTCTSLAGSLSFRAIYDQGSGGKREARMRRKDQLRATKLRQVARQIKHGSSKARRLTPVKRAAEAERDYRRKRP